MKNRRPEENLILKIARLSTTRVAFFVATTKGAEFSSDFLLLVLVQFFSFVFRPFEEGDRACLVATDVNRKDSRAAG